MHLLLILVVFLPTTLSDDCYSVNGQSFCLCSITGEFSPDVEHDGKADHCQPSTNSNLTTYTLTMTKISFFLSLFIVLVLIMVCICSMCVCRDHFCVVIHFTFFTFFLQPKSWITKWLTQVCCEQQRVVDIELSEVVNV
jgi:hypothetical protein